MAYDFQTICSRVIREPAEFVRECDRDYSAHIDSAAHTILSRMDTAPIVLLSGPSGSGKTTTARKIQQRLETLGVRSHTISMDNYFLDYDFATHPKNEEGQVDYESPLCLDLPLLNEHFQQLSRGEEVVIPFFDFPTQSRDRTKGTPLRLGKNEIAIYEGIHALNDLVTGRIGSHATKVYISARSNILDGSTLKFKGTWIRFVRRIVRDEKFRGSDPKFTMSLWENIRRGEKKFISPFKTSSDVLFDSSLPYEVSLLRDYALPLFREIPDCARASELRDLREALAEFPSLSQEVVPEDSLLREFIGGGIY